MADLSKFDVVYPLPGVGQVKSQVVLQRGLAGFRRLMIAYTVDVAAHSDKQNEGFVEELKRVAAFTHPGIPQLHSIAVENNQLVVLGELSSGATLAEMAAACQAQGYSVPIGFTLRTVVDAAWALHYAHTFVDPLGRSLPVIHGEVADERVLTTYDGATKVLGFGLPRAARPAKDAKFASPEQRKGSAADARSDVFSLAAVLHSLLTGLSYRYGEVLSDARRLPSPAEFPAPSARNPEVPLEVDGVVTLALSPDPAKRYATAQDFATALQNAAQAALWAPDQCGALVQQFFADRREQARMQVENAESGSSTAVMPLAQVLKSAPARAPTPAAQRQVVAESEVTAPKGPSIQAVPTQPRLARPDEVMETSDDQSTQLGVPGLVPEQPTRPRALSGEAAQARPQREITQDLLMPPMSNPGAGPAGLDGEPEGDEDASTSARAGPGAGGKALRFVGALVFVTGVTCAALWFLQPALARSLLDKARGRLGMTHPAPPAEQAALPPTRGEEVPDAGELANSAAAAAPDAGAEDDDAALAQGEPHDAGTSKKSAAASAAAKKKQQASHKRKGRY